MLWVAQNALILSPNFTDSNVKSGGPDNVSRGYGAFLGLSQPSKPLYRKYSAVGRTVRIQVAVFSDTVSLHNCCAVRQHGPPTSGLCSTDDSQWTRILPFPQRAELWGGLRQGNVLSTRVAYVCGPMLSVLTTGGGGQASTKYRGPGGPEGAPTLLHMFLT
jgi:hypothetical protein